MHRPLARGLRRFRDFKHIKQFSRLPLISLASDGPGEAASTARCLDLSTGSYFFLYHSLHCFFNLILAGGFPTNAGWFL